MNPLDTRPPEEGVFHCTIDVLLVYADGHTAKGYQDGWTGWMRWRENGWPGPVEDDAEQPIGWRLP